MSLHCKNSSLSFSSIGLGSFCFLPRVSFSFKAFSPVSRAVTNYKHTSTITNTPDVFLIPYCVTRLQADRRHHLNAIIKELYTARFGFNYFHQAFIDIGIKHEGSTGAKHYSFLFSWSLTERDQERYQALDHTGTSGLYSPLLPTEVLKTFRLYENLEDTLEAEVLKPDLFKQSENTVEYIAISHQDFNQSGAAACVVSVKDEREDYELIEQYG